VWDLRLWLVAQWRAKGAPSSLGSPTGPLNGKVSDVIEDHVEHGARRAEPNRPDTRIDVITHDGCEVITTLVPRYGRA
jgi:hypothetical protein